MNKNSYRTFVLMGDGEQAEGSVYEAVMAANHYKLDNLVAILDRNELQISGRTEDVMSLEPIEKRWVSFGWEVYHANGDIIKDLVSLFDNLNYNNKKPKLIIAHTTKGEGISFMEKNPKWHHGVPSEEQYNEAIIEIDKRINSLKEKIYELS
jgi:transketolase